MLPFDRPPTQEEWFEHAHAVLTVLGFQATMNYFGDQPICLQLGDEISMCLETIEALYPHLAERVQDVVTFPSSRGG